jgi:hypothetical protein
VTVEPQLNPAQQQRQQRQLFLAAGASLMIVWASAAVQKIMVTVSCWQVQGEV